MFTPAFAVEAWSFAVTLGVPANSSNIAIISGVAAPAIHTFFLVIVLFLSNCDLLCLDRTLDGRARVKSTTPDRLPEAGEL
jgi:hypothetical protein